MGLSNGRVVFDCDRVALVPLRVGGRNIASKDSLPFLNPSSQSSLMATTVIISNKINGTNKLRTTDGGSGEK